MPAILQHRRGNSVAKPRSHSAKVCRFGDLRAAPAGFEPVFGPNRFADLQKRIERLRVSLGSVGMAWRHRKAVEMGPWRARAAQATRPGWQPDGVAGARAQRQRVTIQETGGAPEPGGVKSRASLPPATQSRIYLGRDRRLRQVNRHRGFAPVQVAATIKRRVRYQVHQVHAKLGGAKRDARHRKFQAATAAPDEPGRARRRRQPDADVAKQS